MSVPGTPLLVLDRVSRDFDGGRIVALREVSLELRRRDLVALAGPSGCGKTTLLNLMAGLDLPGSGSVTFDGERDPSASHWARLRRTRIGLGFQDFNLLATMSAVENVELAMFGTGRRARDRRSRALELLAATGVAHCARRRPPEMSGGERRRVGIARALANDPVLLLADEPTSNLDSASGAAVIDLLLRLHAERTMATVIVTHDAALFARCTRRIRMLDGAVVADERDPD